MNLIMLLMVDIMTNYKNLGRSQKCGGVIPGNRNPTPPWIISRSPETKQE